jgi:NAD(P)-dependent dehydrogenase (short-subunit alcohol dehydrogenase family)
MQGKTCVVTGANSGIGKSLATSFAKQGANVVLVCRSPERGAAALDEVKRDSGRTDAGLELRICDVGDLDSVRGFAANFLTTNRRIDVLMNNAGVYLPKRLDSPQGHESTFAINHLGPHAITNLLLDRLEGARVITTSSMAHLWGSVDPERVANPSSYWAMRVYGTSKLCNVLFTSELARRHGAGGTDDRGIAASCFHPGPVGTGFAQDESGLLNLGMKIAKFALLTADQGADTGLWLATGEEGGRASGGYYTKRKLVKPSPRGRDAALAGALWTKSAALTGLG